MRRLRYLYLRSLVGVPPVLVAAGWLAIWLLWPSGRIAESAVRRPSGMTIRYTQAESGLSRASVDSDIAVIPSSAVRFIDDKDDLAVLLFSQSWSSPKYLEERVKRDGCVTPWVGEKLSGADILAGDSYRSRWDHAPVFSRGTTGEMQLGIELSPGLQSREFQAADLPAEAQKASRQPWQAVMQVEIGNDGRVEDVFLEGGSGNQALDAMLVRWAYRGKVSRAGERCSGRVAVNFGAR